MSKFSVDEFRKRFSQKSHVPITEPPANLEESQDLDNDIYGDMLENKDELEEQEDNMLSSFTVKHNQATEFNLSNSTSEPTAQTTEHGHISLTSEFLNLPSSSLGSRIPSESHEESHSQQIPSSELPPLKSSKSLKYGDLFSDGEDEDESLGLFLPATQEGPNLFLSRERIAATGQLISSTDTPALGASGFASSLNSAETTAGLSAQNDRPSDELDIDGDQTSRIEISRAPPVSDSEDDLFLRDSDEEDDMPLPSSPQANFPSSALSPGRHERYPSQPPKSSKVVAPSSKFDKSNPLHLSKKRQQELQQETMRLRRSQELAPTAVQVRVSKMAEYLTMFGKRPQIPGVESIDEPEMGKNAQVDSAATEPEKSLNDYEGAAPDLDHGDINDQPSSSQSPHTSPEKSVPFAGTHKNISKLIPVQRLTSFVQGHHLHLDDSDSDDLEIIPPTAWQKVPGSIKKLSAFASIEIPRESASAKKKGRNHTHKEFLEALRKKEHEASVKEREIHSQLDDKQITKAEDDEALEEEVETLLEKEQRIAADLRRKEIAEYDDKDAILDDEEEDETWAADDEENEDEDETWAADDEEEVEEEIKHQDERDDGGEEEVEEDKEHREEEDEERGELEEVNGNISNEINHAPKDENKSLSSLSQNDGFENSDASEDDIRSFGKTHLKRKFQRNIALDDTDSDDAIDEPHVTTQVAEQDSDETAEEDGSNEPSLSQRSFHSITESNGSQDESTHRDPSKLSSLDDDIQPSHALKLKKRRTLSKAAKGVMEMEAVESEDEWMGVGGAEEEESDEDEGYRMEGLVDDKTKENINETEVQKLFADNERERDDEMVKQLLDDVNGGFRKRKTGGDGLMELSDYSDDDSYERERLKREERRKQKLLESDAFAAIANNPKAQAFLLSHAEEKNTRVVQMRATESKPSEKWEIADLKRTLSFLEEKEEGDSDPSSSPIKAARSDTVADSPMESNVVADADRLDRFELLRSVNVSMYSTHRRSIKRRTDVLSSVMNFEVGDSNKVATTLLRNVSKRNDTSSSSGGEKSSRESMSFKTLAVNRRRVETIRKTIQQKARSFASSSGSWN